MKAHALSDLPVNPVKAKHLDNMRSATKDKTTKLAPAVEFSLERAIEYIDTDELVEATPKSLRPQTLREKREGFGLKLSYGK